ncbi:MAG: serine hydrolase [Flammeovirgaceae bacterium]|nr:serine hydrolase [Flammeovirgaceae bacterium]
MNDLVRYDGVMGDGNVYSSAEDLYKWDQALYTEKLVKKSTQQEAFTPGILNDGTKTEYGFGWGIVKPGETVAHTGGWVGFRTIIVRYINSNQTLIVLDNSGNGYAHRAVRNIWENKPYEIPTTQLITNVKLVDGTGLLFRNASVRIVNDRIGATGDLTRLGNESVIDGKGFVLAPGFIDSHSHHFWGLQKNPGGLPLLTQGITSIVIGQDGGSYSMDSLQIHIEKTPLSVNVASYTGHSTLREAVMKDDLSRAATSEEVDSMKKY